MDNGFDELFIGRQPAKKPATSVKKSPAVKKQTPLQEGEGSDVCIIPHKKEKDVYAEKTEKNEDVLIKNVERACGGNKYLESMIIGEIINTPRSRYLASYYVRRNH